MLDNYLKSIIACPKCKGELLEKENEVFCSSCGIHYPVDDGIPVLFLDSTYDDMGDTLSAWNKHWAMQPEPVPSQIESEPDIMSAYNHVKKYLLQFPSDNFLEAGCGSGRLLYLLGKTGVKVIGMDMCVEALKHTRNWLRKAGINDAYFLCGDMRHVPIKESCVGLIYGGGSIEHFEETQLGINELRRVLRKGGLLTLTYPVLSLASLTYRQLYGNIPELPVLKKIFKFLHVNVFRKKFMIFGLEKSFFISTMEKYYKKAGFTNVSSAYFDTYLEIAVFKSEFVKKLLRKTAKNPLFWPMTFTNGVK